MTTIRTDAAALRSQRGVPLDDRQSGVALRFGAGVRSDLLTQFYRIRLDQVQLGKGEADFFRANVHQPQRVARPACLRCAEPMTEIARNVWRCETVGCEQLDGQPSIECPLVVGPVRGVVQVVTAAEDVCLSRQVDFSYGTDYHTGRPYVRRRLVQWVVRCLLILDRRYDGTVLADVYRRAGEVCDINGWRLL